MPKKPESPGVALNRLRWKNTTEEERSEIARKLNEARWGVKKMCPCGCGQTLKYALKRHPKRVEKKQLTSAH